MLVLKKKYVPVTGIMIFIFLYIYAASLYPGGSQADATSAGFDWVNNYWCNLMNEKALNGRPNGARAYAIVANLVLAVTLAYFFYTAPQQLKADGYWKRVIPYSGMCSMAFAALLFTPYHDIVSVLSGFFGVIALAGIFKGLIDRKYKGVVLLGLGCILCIVLNNIIYFSGWGIYYLPVLQKFTMIYIFFWLIKLNLALHAE